MENSLLVSLVIATIAIVPGIWALINQTKKDRVQAQFDMHRASENAVFNIVQPIREEMSRLQIRARALEANGSYERPVIVRCDHCRSPNVITSLSCIKCGAPLENL
jgi:hypothetical protein